MLKKIWNKVKRVVCVANSFITGFGIGYTGATAIIALSPVAAVACVGFVGLWYLNFQWALALDNEVQLTRVQRIRRTHITYIPTTSHA